MNKILLSYSILGLMLLSACNLKEHNKRINDAASLSTNNAAKRQLSRQFKDYWYSGKAELTSYKLEQERYGEIHHGMVVNIFVTEDFLNEEQVKANAFSADNTSIMKFNQMKQFYTGIYPYLIMTSTFSPILEMGHALKLSNTVQEWCGQSYMQLNSREDYEIISHTYFQGEADQKVSLQKTNLENELWNILRINPTELPLGKFTIIPSFEYLRLDHKEIKSYNATARLIKNDSINVYSVNYENLNRKLKIYYENIFPYAITQWEEYGSYNDSLVLKTRATRNKTIYSNYWSQNKNINSGLRDSLGLNPR